MRVIDLFAGPGGLAEGFTSIADGEGNRVFKVVLSIEKETAPFNTLRLRAFFRQFPLRQVPTGKRYGMEPVNTGLFHFPALVSRA